MHYDNDFDIGLAFMCLGVSDFDVDLILSHQ